MSGTAECYSGFLMCSIGVRRSAAHRVTHPAAASAEYDIPKSLVSRARSGRLDARVGPQGFLVPFTRSPRRHTRYALVCPANRVSYSSDLNVANARYYHAEHVGFLSFARLHNCKGHHSGNCSSGVSSIDLTRPCAGYTRVALFSRRSLQVARTTGSSKA